LSVMALRVCRAGCAGSNALYASTVPDRRELAQLDPCAFVLLLLDTLTLLLDTLTTAWPSRPVRVGDGHDGARRAGRSPPRSDDKILETCGPTLADEATLLVPDWYGEHGRVRATVAGADPPGAHAPQVAARRLR
jgi:hypothetical protein